MDTASREASSYMQQASRHYRHTPGHTRVHNSVGGVDIPHIPSCRWRN
jgi:hypothetical protein